PGNLGHLDVDFAADDADTLHQLRARSRYVDIRVYQTGSPGPRHIEFMPDEWDVISRSSRGDGVLLGTRSMANAPGAVAHSSAAARIGTAALDASSLLSTGGPPGSAPTMWRYSMHGAGLEPYITGVGGACLGCHVAVSPDGSRLTAGTQIGTDAQNRPI